MLTKLESFNNPTQDPSYKIGCLCLEGLSFSLLRQVNGNILYVIKFILEANLDQVYLEEQLTWDVLYYLKTN